MGCGGNMKTRLVFEKHILGILKLYKKEI